MRERSSRFRLLSLCAVPLLLIGCSAADQTAVEEETTVGTPEISAVPDEEEVASYLKADCRHLVPANLVQVFTEAGWTAERTVPWVAEGVSLPEGMLCVWGDEAANESGEGSVFGWARASSEDATGLRTALVESGWLEVEHAAGAVLTEANPAGRVDGGGLGASYLLTPEGEIRFAATLEEALLISAPG